MMTARYLLIFAVVIGVTWGENSTESQLLSSQESVSITNELQEQFDLKSVHVNKTLNDVESRCQKYGGPDAYSKAANASLAFQKCISGLVNTTELQIEIEDSKSEGKVDEVFIKYCDKKPLFESCLYNFFDIAKNCLAAEGQNYLNIMFNITEQLMEFICFNEGDRIALFIAEGGQECFQDNQKYLQNCFNKTLGMEPALYIQSIQEDSVSFDEKRCKQIFNFEKCVEGVLATCPKPTSANIVESLFKYIWKSTPCQNFTLPGDAPGSAAGIYVTSLTILSAVAANILA